MNLNDFEGLDETRSESCPYLHTDNCKNVYKGRGDRVCHTEKHVGCGDYQTIKFGETHN